MSKNLSEIKFILINGLTSNPSNIFKKPALAFSNLGDPRVFYY